MATVELIRTSDSSAGVGLGETVVKAVLAARDSKRLSGSELVDRNGHYTDDPLQVILDPMARESSMSGALLPAGPKGFGILLMVELLSSLLSGERTWDDEKPSDGVNRAAFYGQSFVAIDIATFQGLSEFTASADRMIATLTGSAPAQGFDRVRLHGEKAAEAMRDNQAHGIYMRDEEWQLVLDAADRLGIDVQA